MGKRRDAGNLKATATVPAAAPAEPAPAHAEKPSSKPRESKPHVTRTMAPIHFEDLDPHRFEDLVRQLAYDFRQWQSIESTGRGGADDGFDIRAYEVVSPS